MKIHRRFLLEGLIALSATLALPRLLFAARPDKAFGAKDADSAIANLFGGATATKGHVTLKIPEIAENGAVVPVTVSTDLSDVESISVVVDNNPTPLAASFELGPKSVPMVSVRIKMAESSPVRAIVNAGGKLYSTQKDVKVTIGGCGG